MNLKVSVIVPIYNVQLYLPQCLDSLLNQTLEDIEIICVNDGSTDQSLEILEEYGAKSDKIKIISQKNQGLSAARNKGLEIAIGTYIAFVDSDDFIDYSMLEDMYGVAIKQKSDLVICDYERFVDSCKYRYNSKDLDFHDIKILDNAVEDFYCGKIEGYAWNKLYSRKLFDSKLVRYPVGLYYEDMAVTLKCLLRANKVTMINCKYYKYRERENSISKNVKDKHIKDFYNQVEYCIKLTDCYTILNAKNAFKINNYIAIYTLSMYRNNFNLKEIGEFKEHYFDKLIDHIDVFSVFKNHNISIKNKFIYLLIKIKLYPIIYRIKKIRRVRRCEN